MPELHVLKGMKFKRDDWPAIYFTDKVTMPESEIRETGKSTKPSSLEGY